MRAFQPFSLTSSRPTLGEALPSDTMNHHTLSNTGQSLPARQLTFSTLQPEKVLPIQAASFHLCRQMTASASRPHNFTFPSLPCPTVSLDLPSDAGEVLPARQPCLFKSHAGDTYSSDTVGIVAPVGHRREPHSQTTYRFILGLALARLTRRLGEYWPPVERRSWATHLIFPFRRATRPSRPSLRSCTACRTPSLPNPQTLFPRLARLTRSIVLSLNLPWMLARALPRLWSFSYTRRQGYPLWHRTVLDLV